MTKFKGLWSLAIAITAGVAAPCAQAQDPPSRPAVANEISASAMEITRRGHGGADKSDAEAAAAALRHRADFDRAVQLYTQDAADDAAFKALSYIMLYCSVAEGGEKERCARILPAARQAVLAHHVGHPNLRNLTSAVLGGRDADNLAFADALFDKAGAQVKKSIAETAGNRWVEIFHGRDTAPALRETARGKVMKYGTYLKGDLTQSEWINGKIRMLHAKGQGMINAVETLVVGKVMPDFGYTTVTREPVSLASQRGKVLLVDYWATWCKPCVAGMPAIKQFREELQAKGLPFEAISINTGDSIEEMVEFQRTKVSMPWINWHEDTGTETYFHIGLTGLPTYYVLDAKGVILARGGHFDERMKDVVRAAARDAAVNRGSAQPAGAAKHEVSDRGPAGK